MFQIGSINWYLTKTNNAIEKISRISPPADGKELRFQYSSLIESIFSSIDYLNDNYLLFSSAKDYIDKEIIRRLGAEGRIILTYMRNTRNAVIHRGLDISARGDEVNGRIALHTPTGITDQWRKAKTKPSEKMLDILLYDLDRVTKELIHDELTRLGFLKKNNSQVIAELAHEVKTITLPDDVPAYAKAMFTAYQNDLDTHTANQISTLISNTLIANLEENLSPRMDISYLP